MIEGLDVKYEDYYVLNAGVMHNWFPRGFEDIIHQMNYFAKHNCKKNIWYDFFNRIMLDDSGALYVETSYLKEAFPVNIEPIHTEYELMEVKENT